MGLVIGIIIGLESRAGRAPEPAATGASAWLMSVLVFGCIPFLLSNDTACSYAGRGS
jgi:hypothetical protein